MNSNNNIFVNDNITSPIIILGSPYSGTIRLQMLLNKSFRIYFFNNNLFESYYSSILSKSQNWDEDVTLKSAVEMVYEKLSFTFFEKKHGIILNKEQIVENISTKNITDIISAICYQFAAQLKMVRWGLRISDQIDTWSTVYNLFPQAKFILLIQNLLDTQSSLYKSIQKN
jgi:hypothetical protein